MKIFEHVNHHRYNWWYTDCVYFAFIVCVFAFYNRKFVQIEPKFAKILNFFHFRFIIQSLTSLLWLFLIRSSFWSLFILSLSKNEEIFFWKHVFTCFLIQKCIKTHQSSDLENFTIFFIIKKFFCKRIGSTGTLILSH